ncbi:MAG TPA: serine/threonine-protein kinase, partial [Pirellulaceae bacterium]|nr:serine/threonine-protein kinase [Pirellulaceae bacterium]
MKFTYSTGARPLEGFTIKRGIGSGGFGEVYYALSDAGKEVALKRIQRHLDIELRGVRQCLNLKHPNLLSLFDIRHDDHGDAWVVMEYIVGESLHELLERHPQGLPAPEVQRWFEGLAAGVGYLHDRGIVHRDLKPGNVFLDEGIVKIGDYGLSKYISCSRRSGQTESVGTFHYMAPEIGRGSYGRQIDIYALGIMLYEMFTGRLPFDGESSQEIIMKHLTADPDLSAVPSAYREVIRRALLKDPEKRFANVEEMVRAAGWSSVGLHGSPNFGSPVANTPNANALEANSPALNAAAPKVVADDAPILLAARDEVERAKSNDASVEVVAAEIVTPGNASPANGRARDIGGAGAAGGGYGAAAQHGKHAHAAGRAAHGGQAGHAG